VYEGSIKIKTRVLTTKILRSRNSSKSCSSLIRMQFQLFCCITLCLFEDISNIEIPTHLWQSHVLPQIALYRCLYSQGVYCIEGLKMYYQLELGFPFLTQIIGISHNSLTLYRIISCNVHRVLQRLS
jgi:hypothetical protein